MASVIKLMAKEHLFTFYCVTEWHCTWVTGGQKVENLFTIFMVIGLTKFGLRYACQEMKNRKNSYNNDQIKSAQIRAQNCNSFTAEVKLHLISNHQRLSLIFRRSSAECARQPQAKQFKGMPTWDCRNYKALGFFLLSMSITQQLEESRCRYSTIFIFSLNS